MIQLTTEQRASIKQITDATIAHYIDTLPQRLTKILNRAVASLIGFQYSDWNGETRIQIDHCNGRRSTVTDIVDTRCKETIAEHLIPIINKAITDLTNDPKFIQKFTAEISDKYKRTLTYAIEERARHHASTAADALLKALEKENLGDIHPTNTDIEDPNSYNTPLGNILLEERAKLLGQQCQPS